MQNEIRDMNDGERVVHTANLLDISEFEVFRRAHLQWYGCEPELEQLEQHFVQYLYFGATAPWVRHYARSILGASSQPIPRSPRSRGLAAALARLVETRLGRFLAS
jgi:hypothetical protein